MKVINKKDYMINCFGWTDSYSELVTVAVMYYCYNFSSDEHPTIPGC